MRERVEFRTPAIWAVSRKEISTIQEKANQIVLNLLFNVTPVLAKIVDQGAERETLSEFVPGRAEDEQIAIDEAAEKVAITSLEKSSKELGLPFLVLSEHQNYELGPKPFDLTIALDPFDNSDEYQKGIDTPPHLVFSLYDLKGNAIAAGDANLFTQHLYINRDGKNYHYNPKTEKLRELTIPQRIKSIEDPAFVLASYFGRDEYSKKFNQHFDRLNQKRFKKSTFHGKGGAHIYAYLATGAISAYVMFDEPPGEIDPGLPFALSSGCTVVSVNRHGGFEDYKFDPR